MHAQRRPSARTASAVLAAFAASSSAIATSAPSRANASAIARPIPWPAPVTSATRPARRPPLFTRHSARSIETGIALMRGMPVYGSNSRSPSTSRPVVLPISRYSPSRSGASPNACDIESTPRRSSGAAAATPRMLAWSDAIRTVSPSASPSAARSSGCRNAGL